MNKLLVCLCSFFSIYAFEVYAFADSARENKDSGFYASTSIVFSKPSAKGSELTLPGRPSEGEIKIGIYKKKPSNSTSYDVRWGYKINQNLRFDFGVFKRSYVVSYEGNDVIHPSINTNSKLEMRQELESFGAMLNGYLEKPIGRFIPYVTVGLGFSENSTADLYIKKHPMKEASTIHYRGILDGSKCSTFSWKVGTGFAAMLNEHVSLDVGYHFINLGRFENGSTVKTLPYYQDFSRELLKPLKASVSSHELMMGLVYKF